MSKRIKRIKALLDVYGTQIIPMYNQIIKKQEKTIKELKDQLRFDKILYDGLLEENEQLMEELNEF